jgi:membrane protein implicated in regulation of membrane protease activity
MELRGTTWELRNAGAAMLPAGARVRVTAVTGVELRVERVGG